MNKRATAGNDGLWYATSDGSSEIPLQARIRGITWHRAACPLARLLESLAPSLRTITSQSRGTQTSSHVSHRDSMHQM